LNSKIDTAHLRHVALTSFDVQLLGLLMKSGGEYPMPETPEAKMLLEVTRSKGLIEVVERSTRQFVRLTDEGRVVCTQLEVMASQPRLEVASR